MSVWLMGRKLCCTFSAKKYFPPPKNSLPPDKLSITSSKINTTMPHWMSNVVIQW
jgi:hypothetical protein